MPKLTNEWVSFYRGDRSTAKRYRVISYKEIVDAAINMYRTVGGVAFDYGDPIRLEELILRVRAEEEDARYGTRNDLIAFFNGEPFYYIDHFGYTHEARFASKTIAGAPLSTMIAGTEAWFHYKVTIAILSDLDIPPEIVRVSS